MTNTTDTTTNGMTTNGMTTNGMTTTDNRDAELGHDDPRRALARAMAAARPVIAAVRPDQMALPTPCDEFDVRQLLGHLLFAVHRAAVVGRDGDGMTVPLVGEGVNDDAWVTEWDAADHDLQEAWSDAAELTKQKVLPWATLPAPVVLAMYTSEVVVHTWDLATATGQTVRFQDDLVAASLQIMHHVLPTAERVDEIPFADAIELADGAAPIDQLLAWVGRRP